MRLNFSNFRLISISSIKLYHFAKHPLNITDIIPHYARHRELPPPGLMMAGQKGGNFMNVGCEKICKILMERDGLNRQDAVELVEAARFEIKRALYWGDTEGVEDVMTENLGLGLDYIPELLL